MSQSVSESREPKAARYGRKISKAAGSKIGKASNSQLHDNNSQQHDGNDIAPKMGRSLGKGSQTWPTLQFSAKSTIPPTHRVAVVQSAARLSGFLSSHPPVPGIYSSRLRGGPKHASGTSNHPYLDYTDSLIRRYFLTGLD